MFLIHFVQASSRKTNIAAQVKAISDKLSNKNDEVKVVEVTSQTSVKVFVCGLGASINRAIVVALDVIKFFNGVVAHDIVTSTVSVSYLFNSFIDVFHSM